MSASEADSEEIRRLYDASIEAEGRGEHNTAHDLRLVAARLAYSTGETVSLDEVLAMLGTSSEEVLRDAENTGK